MKNIKLTAVLLLVLTFIIVKPAYAYLDPGTGSYLLQMVLAGVLGGAYIFKGYIAKIFSFIRSLFTKVDAQKNEEKE